MGIEMLGHDITCLEAIDLHRIRCTTFMRHSPDVQWLEIAWFTNLPSRTCTHLRHRATF
jgi:hypothetical protein